MKAHPEPGESKSARWSDDDIVIQLADGVAGKEVGEGTHKVKTITTLQVVDGDFYNREANYVHITTPTDCGVLLQPRT